MTHGTNRYADSELCFPTSGQAQPGASPAPSDINQPRVAIVLLNWNGYEDTLECIRSLRRMEYRNWHAVIVDNGSSDGSVERLAGLSRGIGPRNPQEFGLCGRQ